MSHLQSSIDQRLVSLTRPTSLEAEQYQTLRLNLQRLKAARDTRMIAMTSPTSGDGKTLNAINLAGALARGADTRVLLVEADLRRPTLAAQLGLAATGDGGGSAGSRIRKCSPCRSASMLSPTCASAYRFRSES